MKTLECMKNVNIKKVCIYCMWCIYEEMLIHSVIIRQGQETEMFISCLNERCLKLAKQKIRSNEPDLQ